MPVMEPYNGDRNDMAVVCPRCMWGGRLRDTVYVLDSAAECPKCGAKVERLEDQQGENGVT